MSRQISGPALTNIKSRHSGAVRPGSGPLRIGRAGGAVAVAKGVRNPARKTEERVETVMTQINAWPAMARDYQRAYRQKRKRELCSDRDIPRAAVDPPPRPRSRSFDGQHTAT